MSKTPNLGWIFNKEAFEPPEDISCKEWYTSDKYENSHSEKTEETRKKLTHNNLSDYKDPRNQQLDNPNANRSISDLVTTYPGLLIGSGYNHQADLEGEYKFGFYFDHTTGMPVIPGSSVKGSLRQVFPTSFTGEKDKRVEFLKWLLTLTNEDIEASDSDSEIPTFNIGNIDFEVLEALEYSIFEGRHDNSGDRKYESDTSIYERDIFYDAYIRDTNHPPISHAEDHETQNPFLGNDFITPHKQDDREKAHLDPFAEPTPLQFLKVLPGVSFRFQFKLHDSEINGLTVRADQKLFLFRRIMLTLGIGAKTNVGYGQFIAEEEYTNIFGE